MSREKKYLYITTKTLFHPQIINSQVPEPPDSESSAAPIELVMGEYRMNITFFFLAQA